jgi:hypothetical protein
VALEADRIIDDDAVVTDMVITDTVISFSPLPWHVRLEAGPNTALTPPKLGKAFTHYL